MLRRFLRVIKDMKAQEDLDELLEENNDLEDFLEILLNGDEDEAIDDMLDI